MSQGPFVLNPVRVPALALTAAELEKQKCGPDKQCAGRQPRGQIYSFQCQEQPILEFGHEE